MRLPLALAAVLVAAGSQATAAVPDLERARERAADDPTIREAIDEALARIR